MGPNTPLGISWNFSEGKRETSHLRNGSVAGGKRPVGTWVLPITIIIITVVIIMIMFQVHLMVTTGPGPRKRLKKDVISAQRPHFGARCFPVTQSYSPLVPVVGLCLCALTSLTTHMSTQRNCLTHMHFTAALDKPEPLFNITWQVYWHNCEYCYLLRQDSDNLTGVWCWKQPQRVNDIVF